jgi:hypothetical protein
MAHGWTEQRKKRQARLIRTWKPWEWSTGPTTERGKARVAQNAFKHGARSRESLAVMRKIQDLLQDFDRTWRRG